MDKGKWNLLGRICLIDYVWDQVRGKRGFKSYDHEKLKTEIYKLVNNPPTVSTEELVNWAKECHTNVSIHAFDSTYKKFLAITNTNTMTNVTLVYYVKDHHWLVTIHACERSNHKSQENEEKFFREKIDENKGKPKGVWRALKSLSGTSKPRVRINEITTENEVVSDEAVIANEINEYFVNILKQIGNNNDAGVDFENTKLKNFVHSRLNVDTVYNIPLLTIKQTIAITDKISSNKASGYDGLSVRVLKKIAPVFANPLSKLPKNFNIDKKFS